MKAYKLDRTSFSMTTFEEAEKQHIFDKDVPLAERLRQAYYLISKAYGFSMEMPPKLDRSCFSSRKLNQ